MSLSLVNYSSSSESENEEIHHKIKRVKFECPSLTKIKYVLSDECESSEDLKDEHQGRIRSFEHVRGNWATFLYIPVDFELLEDIQESIKDLFKMQINLVATTATHISMTKTVVLRHHWIDSFVISLRNTLSDIRRFKVNFGDINIYCNEEETRTFIGLTISPLFITTLKSIIEKLDEILEEFKLEPFYSNPSFHMSILWCLGDHREFLLNNLLNIHKILEKYILQEPESFEIYVTKFSCKIGNKNFCFNLK